MHEITIAVVDPLSEQQLVQVQKLQAEAFSDLEPEEIEDDFISPEDASVIAMLNDELVGYAGIHHANIVFEDKKVKLGGFGGVCTRSDMRGKGIATRVINSAMEYLKQRGDDVAFLGVDLSKHTQQLYEKAGFVLLPRKFSWEDAKGNLKTDDGGMIAPINSPQLFDYILQSKTTLHVGKGNW